MAEVDVKGLLMAGAHFGHKTSRWHPKMGQYIHSSRNGAHIIDLIQTAEHLEDAMAFVSEQVSKGKQVLFVGTKRQAKDVVIKAAEDTGMPAVYNRWLGGMLTNTKTMKDRIKHLKKLEERMDSGELNQRFNKLEVQRYQEEIDKLNYQFGGIKDMAEKPGVVFVTDILTDQLAVKEANRLGVPVIGIVDTNADPSNVDMVIPANDDAIKSIQTITDYIVSAVSEGKTKAKANPPVKKATVKKEDPKAAVAKKPAPKMEAKTEPAKKAVETEKKPAAKKTAAKKPVKKAEKKEDK